MSTQSFQSTVLNPSLHAALSGLARNGVRINKPSKHAQGRYVASTVDPSREHFEVHEWGETYVLSCPLCTDTRHRLHVSHLFNVRDERTGRFNRHLAKCFNETDCCSTAMGRKTLLDLLKGETGVVLDTKPNVATTAPPPMEPMDLGYVTCIPLDQLPADHPGAIWCRERGHDPVLLSQQFGVCWLSGTGLHNADSRVFAPIWHENMFVGGLARFVDEETGSGDSSRHFRCNNDMCRLLLNIEDNPLPDRCPRCRDGVLNPIPKWYTLPGTPAGRALYNYNPARQWTDFVVCVEGPGDVWRCGTPWAPDYAGPVVGVIGARLKSGQLNLLDPWRERGTVYLCFDGDQWEKTVAQAYDLQERFGGGVVPVPLEEHEDPGSMPHDALWRRIRDAGEYMQRVRPHIAVNLPPIGEGVTV